MATTTKKQYAYKVPSIGAEGITSNWEECKAIVSGKYDARYKGFKTHQEAEAWLRAGARYEIKVKKENVPGIYFDAGTGRGDGVEISVTDEQGNDVLQKVIAKEFINKHGKHLLAPDKTNNYGELLACSYALELAIEEGIDRVFGDSKIIIDYWSKGRIKLEGIAPETRSLAFATKKLRDAFEAKGGVVMRISGDNNPADLGFH
jgi:ribonuclease HI